MKLKRVRGQQILIWTSADVQKSLEVELIMLLTIRHITGLQQKKAETFRSTFTYHHHHYFLQPIKINVIINQANLNIKFRQKVYILTIAKFVNFQ